MMVLVYCSIFVFILCRSRQNLHRIVPKLNFAQHAWCVHYSWVKDHVYSSHNTCIQKLDFVQFSTQPLPLPWPHVCIVKNEVKTQSFCVEELACHDSHSKYSIFIRTVRKMKMHYCTSWMKYVEYISRYLKFSLRLSVKTDPLPPPPPPL